MPRHGAARQADVPTAVQESGSGALRGSADDITTVMARPVAPVLRVEGLTKTYRSRRAPEIRAVSDVSFEACGGEVLGLLGPNGAGKTTTIKMIAGLIRPTPGSVEVAGVDAVRSRRAAARQTAVVLEGNRNVYWRLTVRENLDYFAALRGLRRREMAAG